LLPQLTLIIGGAASGKSVFAEQLCEKHGTSKVYLATAQAFDGEMEKKIALHQNRRNTGWHTVEAPLTAASALRAAQGDVLLFDCATLWLSNQMLAEAEINAAQDDLLLALAECACPVVTVSNEVGQGIVPDTALGRQFREAQGRLNISLAAQADLVVQVTVGLPNLLKGEMP